MDSTENESPAQDTPEAKQAPAPLNATEAVQLSPLDFVTYERNLERVRGAKNNVDWCARELERAQADLSKLNHAHAQHVVGMAAKHNVDLNAMMVSDDGYFMPRPPQVTRR